MEYKLESVSHLLRSQSWARNLSPKHVA